jgi:hypothetical protein
MSVRVYNSSVSRLSYARDTERREKIVFSAMPTAFQDVSPLFKNDRKRGQTPFSIIFL